MDIQVTRCLIGLCSNFLEQTTPTFCDGFAGKHGMLDHHQV